MKKHHQAKACFVEKHDKKISNHYLMKNIPFALVG